MAAPPARRGPPRRVLLIEDHTELSLWLGKVLRALDLEVELAADGIAGDERLARGDWDLVLLDLSLPGLDGFELLRRLRQRDDPVPVLVLTARGDVRDRIKGLNLGADDYLVKPFDIGEFEARVAALLRRSRGLVARRSTLGELAFDHEQRAFYCGDEPLSLSRREHGLLSTLFERQGRAVSKEFLFEILFADTEANLDAVEVVVFRLRRRIEHCGVRIRTVRGLGYLLERDDG